jgi:hypothetical protein
MTLNVNQVIDTYLKLRSKKSAIQAEVKEKVDSINAKMDKLEAWLKEKADQDGVTSFKTDHGTAFLTTVDFASVADWDAVLQFAKENEAYDLFEKRISKTAVRGYIDLNKSVPAGVNYGTKLEVNVRKPTKKVVDDDE